MKSDSGMASTHRMYLPSFCLVRPDAVFTLECDELVTGQLVQPVDDSYCKDECTLSLCMEAIH